MENGLNLKEGRFTLDIGRKVLTQRGLKQWHRFPREFVDVPIPGGQVGWSLGQPYLVGSNPAYDKEWNGMIG